MQNGKILRSLAFALSATWLGGCDVGAVPSQTGQGSGPGKLTDAGRGRTWTISGDGLLLREMASGETRAVALPGWVVAGPPFGAGAALAIGPGGDVLVTSDVMPAIWRVDQRTLAVSVHRLVPDAHQDKDIGFASLAYSARDGAFVATSSAPAARWRIDAALTRAEKLQ